MQTFSLPIELNNDLICSIIPFTDTRSMTRNMHHCSRKYRAASTSFPTASRRRPDASSVPYCVAIPTSESPAKMFCTIHGWSRMTSTVKSSARRAALQRATTNACQSGMLARVMSMPWLARAAVSMTWCKPPSTTYSRDKVGHFIRSL